MTEGNIIQMPLAAIKATELRRKIISEMGKKLDQSGSALTNFEDIFKANVKRDMITYRNSLKNLKYNDDCNMREFYSKLFGLVAKAMDLDEENDTKSITRLAQNEFISKIPSHIRQALQSADYEDGFALAEAAEKIRSFSRLYLQKNAEVNNFRSMPVKKPHQNSNPTSNNTRNDNTRNWSNNRGQNNRGHSQGHVNRGNNGRGQFQGQHSRGQFHNRNQFQQRQDGRSDNRGGRWNGNNGRYNGQRFNGNRYNSNRNYNNRNSSTNYNRPQSSCHYCYRVGHKYDECRTLRSDISQGKVSPNWEPNRAIRSNHMMALPSTEQSQGRGDYNPLFQCNDGRQ